MDVYREFAAAWVDHVVFGNGNARLAEARHRMEADPGYSRDRYIEALFGAERTAAAFSQHLSVRLPEHPL